MRERHTFRHATRHRHEHQECLVCGEVMPLGPSNDTPVVKLEIWAAEFALGDAAFQGCRSRFGVCAPCGPCARFMGFHDDDVDGDGGHPDDWHAGSLALAIYDHGKEAP
jgi:hypothetical protein